MPAMSLGVNVAAPISSVGVSGGVNTWSGYYEQGGSKFDMALDMTVGNGRIVGYGSDVVGEFDLNGSVNGD